MQAHAAIASTRRCVTVADLLASRAADQPDRLGYTFLADGETDEYHLSYAEADRRARAVAAALRGAGGGPGVRVLLVLPPGLEYITALFGCLYAGALAVPVYPPDPNQLARTLPRLRAVVRDATPLIGLTTSPLLGLLDWVTDQAPELGALSWLAVDEAPEAPVEGEPVPVAPDEPALLQYTSGSTAAPRGVLLSHANLLHNSGLIQRCFQATPATRGLVWLPPYHDMGLIGGLLQPLYGGFPVTLMSPLHFLERPVRWLRAIDRYRATASGGPNFAYELCVRRISPEEAAGLDLSSWEVAFNGAEPIRPETLERFTAAFGPYGFRADSFLACYGLAEATLIVSAGWPARAVPVDRVALEQNRVAVPVDGPVANLTACGPGAGDQLITIVDPATATVCTPDQVGEIWVRGPSVAGGYWGRPEETEQVFAAALSDGRGPFLRTGDLGFLHNGQLVVTGRLKDMIIVRGRNHYPQDIELTAGRADPVLRPGGAAAFVVADGPDERLVLVQEVRRGAEPVDVPAVAARIRTVVAQEHGLQVHTVCLIRAGGLPKTSSGKVQRRECRTRFLSGELPEVGRADAPSSPAAPGGSTDAVLRAAPAERAAFLQEYLRGQVSAMTGVPAEQVGAEQPLLSAGLDSLAVVALHERVTADFAVTLPLSVVMAGASLSELAERLAVRLDEPSGVDDSPVSSTATAALDEIPLSSGERWMWFLQHMEPDSAAHTIAVALRILGPLDRPALARALDELVARHAALRTTFPSNGEEPVRLVQPAGPAAYREHDARQLDAGTLQLYLTRAARRPFNVETGPLLRVDLYTVADGEVLLLSMHHIITDFWSMTILAHELGEYYTAFAEGREPALKPARATYADVLNWQRSRLDDPAHAARLAGYWEAEVAAVRPAPLLTIHNGSAAGGSRRFALSRELTERLHHCAATQRVTLFVLLLAAFEAVLHRYTGQDDVVVGTNAAVRPRAEFADVIGCCTNPVLIRSQASAGEPFDALLSRTRDRVVATLEHQEYPLLRLATRERFGPMFDAMFSFNRSTRPGDDLAAMALVAPSGVRGRLGSLPVETIALPVAPGALPIELVMAEIDGVPHGLLRHRGDVIDEAAADRLVAEFVATLETVVADAGTPLGELGIL
jgi:acyl-CoA synthetase (AMP-forming)/AMP-acid ligase II